ncbi:MAG: RseA family anti-sigma factor [Actinomycetota bacterium]
MNLDDRYSAWLDGELDEHEIPELEAELAGDPELQAEFEALRSVRDLIRAEAMVAMRPGALERIVAEVEADLVDSAPTTAADPSPAAPVVSLAERRRRVPAFAAVAASFAIIVSVVGGLGGDTTLPAVGDLIARHDAAAADMSGDMDMSEMDDMADDMPAMDGSMSMMAAEVDDDLVHAIYESSTGSVVSVFRQDGELDVDELVDEMDGGDTGVMDGLPMWGKDIGDLHVTVLDGDGYVWTIVHDVGAPMDDMMNEVMADLPSRDAGVRERLHDVAEAIVEPFGIGI